MKAIAYNEPLIYDNDFLVFVYPYVDRTLVASLHLRFQVITIKPLLRTSLMSSSNWDKVTTPTELQRLYMMSIVNTENITSRDFITKHVPIDNYVQLLSISPSMDPTSYVGYFVNEINKVRLLGHVEGIIDSFPPDTPLYSTSKALSEEIKTIKDLKTFL